MYGEIALTEIDIHNIINLSSFYFFGINRLLRQSERKEDK